MFMVVDTEKGVFVRDEFLDAVRLARHIGAAGRTWVFCNGQLVVAIVAKEQT